MLLTHTNADRARGVTVTVRASVRAWRVPTACSWLTCSWLTCSDMIVLCSTRVITAFLTELGEGKLLGPDSAWQRSLQQQAWALHAAQVMIMLPVYCSFSHRNKLRIPMIIWEGFNDQGAQDGEGPAALGSAAGSAVLCPSQQAAASGLRQTAFIINPGFEKKP